MSGSDVRIKVCCISSLEEAQLAISLGADALGLVGDMPSGPGIIDDDLAREIARSVPRSVDTFLLTSRESGEDIAEHAAYCGTTTVQIVRHIDVAEYPYIVSRVPAVKRVQVLHVEDWSVLELVELYEPFVDAFLLDSGRPGASVAELGGTGRSHDWRISASVVERTARPVYLAGGLNAQNVARAVEQVHPYGLDLCSAVRDGGRLDERLLSAFVAAAR